MGGASGSAPWEKDMGVWREGVSLTSLSFSFLKCQCATFWGDAFGTSLMSYLEAAVYDLPLSIFPKPHFSPL